MHAPNPIARTFGSWLLLVFTLLLSSTAWAQRDEGPYQIQRAVYGTDQYSIDVTDRLRQLARRDQRFRLTNDLFDADPAPGQRKTLRIFARGPDGQPHTFDFGEYNWVDGAQFSGWSSGRWGRGVGNPGWQSGGYGNADRDHDAILQATYGTPESRFDVTQRIRQLAQRHQRFQLNNDLFNGDPAPGQRKTLQIHMGGYGGQPQILEFAEGSWIDGSRLTGARADQWDQGGRRNDDGYGRVNVQRALYGDGYRQVDITARLRSQVRDGRLKVPVNNNLAGIDPAPGARKRLTVEFSLGNGPVQQTTAHEGQWLRLP
ncbi:hypothetical protein CBP34_05755 [Acidovorax carolinensis]|uniref:DnaJ-like protein C11 C-terminal domain-containing protein n=1 Tax=Acidovorax carolinensis TaxID=553814 RepID=A0A240U084_9BURK|nr:hypothetical protein [Acidovorax carolinensis]ART51265.1 hypothetical protein CBP34_05755 [Acidovorax carolinensis]